jgi:glutamate synthase domain-containing protein 1
VGPVFFFPDDDHDRTIPDRSTSCLPIRFGEAAHVTARADGRYPLYDPAREHDACGTGFIASIEGERTHRLVRLAMRALGNLTHRGAVAADAASGDGAGITIQVPRELLAEEAAHLGLLVDDLDYLAVAMVFLPTDGSSSHRARTLLESCATRGGIEVLGWRVVPTEPSVLGGLALQSLPGIEQLLMARPRGQSRHSFDRALYLARRRAEAAFRADGVDAYIASMSADTVVYKGLMVAPELPRFYPDLADARTRSSLALFHQRFATNTLPDWKLAQPFRRVAHNGEINTLVGNRNWMSAREPELTSSLWNGDMRDLVPVITPIGSDTAALDEALDLHVTSGRDVLGAMAMLIPEAWENMPGMDRRLRAFYQYHACLTEPWDGPASVSFTDGKVAAAVMDRNGLRPARYKLTSDGLVVLGSEVGILELAPEDVVESGRVGPGEMIAVDTVRHRFLTNAEIKAELAQREPYDEWVARNLTHVPRVPNGEGRAVAAPSVSTADLPRLHVLHGYTKEEISFVLEPMAVGGKEPVGSMGDDTPLSTLTTPGRLLYTYFRQRFAQVTNPPIDSIRERIVMSLDTFLGRRGPMLDAGPEAARLVHLSSPVLLDTEMAALRDGAFGGLSAATLSARFDASGGSAALTGALDDLCAAALAAIDQGHDVLVVSDRDVDRRWAPIPTLLAVSTVHHHLIRSGRRMRASIVAEAGDARDVHHFATLIGFGASAVNPYVAFDTVRDLVDRETSGEGAVHRAVVSYVRAVEAGILKVMSKMGIAAVSSYHGAQIFEALGIADEVIARSFPGTTSRIGGIGFDHIALDAADRHASAHAGEKVDRGGW